MGISPASWTVVSVVLVSYIKASNPGVTAESSSSEEFFFNNVVPFFGSPTTSKPSFIEDIENFFGVREEERLFAKEKDIFDQMKKDEEFFFRKETVRRMGKSVKQESGQEDAQVVTQGSRYCNCQGMYCGCCTSVKLLGRESFRGCLEMEYVKNDFAIFITLTINGHVILTRVVSGRNPLPFCARTPYVPLVSFCIRLYDIHHNPRGLSLCVRLEVTSMRQILFSLSFDCIKIEDHRISFLMPTNATTFGVVGLHMGDTDPYISYLDWTKLHFPLPEVSSITPRQPSTPCPTNAQETFYFGSFDQIGPLRRRH
ncbi:uncharacterized protein LOC124374770 [Homalodisca vitripennis]|uniref:uncharacterized protein LOC124374770 n=1 Tax=Homalodisca vitripennis TaxID=197043 RepID=UPI001EEB0262|nr:uncharacterized protein LOC124374770 [Homalodisca vitripennis]